MHYKMTSKVVLALFSIRLVISTKSRILFFKVGANKIETKSLKSQNIMKINELLGIYLFLKFNHTYLNIKKSVKTHFIVL